MFRCFEYKKNYKKYFNKNLIKMFTNIYEFCNGHINKFILLLRKGVYPYEFMDSWKTFDETSLPDRKEFYSSLNMGSITNVDFRHANKMWRCFKNKNLSDYYDLYVKSDTLLLPDVCENFRSKCIQINEIDPAHFFISTRISMGSLFKKTGIELELLTDINMLRKELVEEYVMEYIDMQKQIINT